MKKKWIVFLIIALIAVAVVLTIVFINLFRPKTTQPLAETVYSVTQDGYLNKDNAKNKKIDEYLQVMLSINSLQESHAEIENYEKAYAAFELTGEFFNRQIVFTKYTNAYKNHRKGLEDDFKNAQSAVDALDKYLDENGEKIGDSVAWNERSWIDCKVNVEKMISSTSQAFEKLFEIYQDAVSSKLMNNQLTTLVFEEMKKSMETNALSGETLQTLAQSYLSKSAQNLILNFSYNKASQEVVKDIQEKGHGSAYYSKFLSGQISK